MSRDDRAAALGRLAEAARAAQSASDVLDQAFFDFLGINRTDGRCFAVIDQVEGITAGELARRVGLTTGAVTTVVDRLELAGLVERRSDPDDRRKVIIEPTREARRLAAEIYGPLAQSLRPMLSSLDDQTILTLIGYFETSRNVALDHSRVVRARVAPKKKVSMRYRLEQAKLLKDDAKALLKTIKSDVKDLAHIVVDVAGTRWERGEDGRWVPHQPTMHD